MEMAEIIPIFKSGKNTKQQISKENIMSKL